MSGVRERRGIRGDRAALVLLALGAATVTAHSTHAFFLVDACLDAGGRYLGEPPRCELAGGVVRALDAFPKRSGWWLAVLGPACAVGGAVHAVGRALLRRAQSRS